MLLMRCHDIKGPESEYVMSVFFAQSMTDDEFEDIVDWCRIYANIRPDDIGRRSIFFITEESASKFLLEWSWR